MSKSPTKKSKTGGSPTRRNYDSSVQLTEKEVETDHLKTVVLALN